MCSISLCVHTSVLSIVCPQVEVLIAYGEQMLAVLLAPEKTVREARADIAVEAKGSALDQDLASLRFLRAGPRKIWVSPAQEEKVLLSACLSKNTSGAEDFMPELVLKIDQSGLQVAAVTPTDRPTSKWSII